MEGAGSSRRLLSRLQKRRRLQSQQRRRWHRTGIHAVYRHTRTQCAVLDQGNTKVHRLCLLLRLPCCCATQALLGKQEVEHSSNLPLQQGQHNDTTAAAGGASRALQCCKQPCRCISPAAIHSAHLPQPTKHSRCWRMPTQKRQSRAPNKAPYICQRGRLDAPPRPHHHHHHDHNLLPMTFRHKTVGLPQATYHRCHHAHSTTVPMTINQKSGYPGSNRSSVGTQHDDRELCAAANKTFRWRHMHSGYGWCGGSHTSII